MKEKLAKLIDVKSIMTLLLTVVFCVLALTGIISGQEFLTIFTVIVGFYFGTQATKKAASESDTAPALAEPTGTVVEYTAAIPETVDAATYNATHPSDSDIVVTGFGG